MKTVALGRSAEEEACTGSSPPAQARGAGRNRWLRRVGVLGFWFFLLKGCLWIASLGIAFYFTQ